MRGSLEILYGSEFVKLLQSFHLEDIELRHVKTTQRLKFILTSLNVSDVLDMIKRKFWRFYENSFFEESAFPKHGYIPITTGRHHEFQSFEEVSPNYPVGFYMCQIVPLVTEINVCEHVDLIRKIGVWAVVPQPLTEPDTILIRSGDFNQKPIFSQRYKPSKQSELQNAIAQSLLSYKHTFRSK
jgi:hypothetical protein